MKITVVGIGYVGLVTGACLADYGNDVYCVDVDEKKISSLKKGNIPIYEPGLQTLVKENLEAGRLIFTTNLKESLDQTEICFIAVGTPMEEDGHAELKYVENVASDIGKNMNHHMYIVDKSTVPVGTAGKVRELIQAQLDFRGEDIKFDVISNPEFLKEGDAIADCSRPDRIIIGTDSENAAKMMKQLYLPFVKNTENIIFMDVASAEMTKYAANAMLATKVSFMNEIANICEHVGADINKVRIGIGSDRRIGYQYIYAGCGYGGSCFPKDVQSLIKTSEENGYDCKILKAVEDVNEAQKLRLIQKITGRFGEDLHDLRFGVWGLSFKPGTDDMRMAPAITIINEITKRGGVVKAYDPKAINAAKERYLTENAAVEYCDSKYEALDDADAMILITEWKEFRHPDFNEIKKRLNDPIVFDGRNQYNSADMEEMGFEYYQIGVAEKAVKQ